MEFCEIHDLKSAGRFFTWTNKQNGTARVLSKIDRVMDNHLWDTTFPNSEAIFLPEGDFDHIPMLVHFFKQPRRAKPFKFFNHWGQREDFLASVQEHWNSDSQGPSCYRVIQNLKSIKNLRIRKFKKDEQAALFQAAINLLKAQEEVHADPTNLHLINAECILADTLKKAKSEKDSALRRKAKINWPTMGDENSKIFHHSIKQRHRMNTINVLHVGDEIPTDQTRIQEIFQAYYRDLLCNDIKIGDLSI